MSSTTPEKPATGVNLIKPTSTAKVPLFATVRVSKLQPEVVPAAQIFSQLNAKDAVVVGVSLATTSINVADPVFIATTSLVPLARMM